MIPIVFTHPKNPDFIFTQVSPGNEMTLTVNREIARWHDKVRRLPKKTNYFTVVWPSSAKIDDCHINTYERVPIISAALLKKDEIGRVEVYDRIGMGFPQESDCGLKFTELFRGAPATMYHIEILTSSDLTLKHPRPDRGNSGVVCFFDYDPHEDDAALEAYVNAQNTLQASSHPKVAFEYIEAARSFCDRFNILAEPNIQSALNSYNPARIHRAIVANNRKIEGRILVASLVTGVKSMRDETLGYDFHYSTKPTRGYVK